MNRELACCLNSASIEGVMLITVVRQWVKDYGVNKADELLALYLQCCGVQNVNR